MTIANDADRTAPPPTADGASSNGSATLRDRVRSLRLSEPGAGGKGASFAAVALPWGLCLILAGVTAAFGYYAYAVAPDPRRRRQGVGRRGPEDAQGRLAGRRHQRRGLVRRRGAGGQGLHHSRPPDSGQSQGVRHVDRHRPPPGRRAAVQGGRCPRQDRGRGLPDHIHARRAGLRRRSEAQGAVHRQPRQRPRHPRRQGRRLRPQRERPERRRAARTSFFPRRIGTPRSPR